MNVFINVKQNLSLFTEVSDISEKETDVSNVQTSVSLAPQVTMNVTFTG